MGRVSKKTPIIVVLVVLLLPALAMTEEVTLSGRVLDEKNQPVKGADIRIHLIRFVQPPRVGYEWVHTWQVLSDSEGRYTLEGVRSRENGASEVHVDFMAAGFVDARDQFSLGKLLASRTATVSLPDTQLRSGIRMSGRCLGADDKPAIGAKIYSLSVSAEGEQNPSHGLWYARPRTTDAQGRFEFWLPPDVKTELIVYPDAWAPKRIEAPSSRQERNLGDIQLDRGTRVSGRLLGDKGMPLAGYWLLAKSTDVGAFSSAINPIKMFQKTDRLGQFEFPPLKGEFDVEVVSHTFPWPTEEVIYSPRPMPAIVGQVHTFDGRIEHVNLTLQAVPSVRVQGKCIGPNGEPVHGNQVGISIQKGNQTVNLQVATTDAEGRYVFEGIPRGIKDVWLSSSLGWVDGSSVTLKALPHVKGARPDGQIHWDHLDADADGVDFGVESSQPSNANSV